LLHLSNQISTCAFDQIDAYRVSRQVVNDGAAVNIRQQFAGRAQVFRQFGNGQQHGRKL